MNALETFILAKWLGEKVTEWEKAAKPDLGLLVGERKAAVVEGMVIGHVTMAKGARRAKVANENALLAWVADNHPTEIETVTRIRPAFLTSLLDKAKRVGAMVDSDGVVIDGLIEVSDGPPTAQRKLTDDADIIIAELLQRGAIGVSGLKALTPVIDAEVVE